MIKIFVNEGFMPRKPLVITLSGGQIIAWTLDGSDEGLRFIRKSEMEDLESYVSELMGPENKVMSIHRPTATSDRRKGVARVTVPERARDKTDAVIELRVGGLSLLNYSFGCFRDPKDFMTYSSYEVSVEATDTMASEGVKLEGWSDLESPLMELALQFLNHVIGVYHHEVINK